MLNTDVKKSFYQAVFMAMMLFSFGIGHTNGGSNQKHDDENPYFIGTSAFLLINLVPNPPLYFGQIDFGYHFSKKDILVLEALLWNYFSPMGSTEISGPKYPGSVLAYGLSFAYQRFLWKGFYITSHLTPLITNYSDQDQNFMQSGFQPWIQLRPGYHFKMSLISPRLYIEPSLEINYWPLNFNVPESFQKLDDEHPNYLVAPGLNFGKRF